MSEQPADRQAEHKKAIETHIDLKNGLMFASDCIQDACNRLKTQQRQDGLILQHTAISLAHVNPTAESAVVRTMSFSDLLVKDITQRTGDLNKLIATIPEPPAPPAEEEPEDTGPAIKDCAGSSGP